MDIETKVTSLLLKVDEMAQQLPSKENKIVYIATDGYDILIVIDCANYIDNVKVIDDIDEAPDELQFEWFFLEHGPDVEDDTELDFKKLNDMSHDDLYEFLDLIRTFASIDP